MTKSIKLKDNSFVDSTGIVHNRELLSNILNSLQTQINNINSTLTNYLYKTGIGLPNNNMNDALSDGCYYWTDTATNKPPTNYGTVFVTVSSGPTGNNLNNWVNQLAFGTDAHIYFRQKINAGAWSAWVLVK